MSQYSFLCRKFKNYFILEENSPLQNRIIPILIKCFNILTNNIIYKNFIIVSSENDIYIYETPIMKKGKNNFKTFNVWYRGKITVMDETGPQSAVNYMKNHAITTKEEGWCVNHFLILDDRSISIKFDGVLVQSEEELFDKLSRSFIYNNGYSEFFLNLLINLLKKTPGNMLLASQLETAFDIYLNLYFWNGSYISREMFTILIDDVLRVLMADKKTFEIGLSILWKSIFPVHYNINFQSMQENTIGGGYLKDYLKHFKENDPLQIPITYIALTDRDTQDLKTAFVEGHPSFSNYSFINFFIDEGALLESGSSFISNFCEELLDRGNIMISLIGDVNILVNKLFSLYRLETPLHPFESLFFLLTNIHKLKEERDKTSFLYIQETNDIIIDFDSSNQWYLSKIDRTISTLSFLFQNYPLDSQHFGIIEHVLKNKKMVNFLFEYGEMLLEDNHKLDRLKEIIFGDDEILMSKKTFRNIIIYETKIRPIKKLLCEETASLVKNSEEIFSLIQEEVDRYNTQKYKCCYCLREEFRLDEIIPLHSRTFNFEAPLSQSICSARICHECIPMFAMEYTKNFLYQINISSVCLINNLLKCVFCKNSCMEIDNINKMMQRYPKKRLIFSEKFVGIYRLLWLGLVGCFREIWKSVIFQDIKPSKVFDAVTFCKYCYSMSVRSSNHELIEELLHDVPPPEVLYEYQQEREEEEELQDEGLKTKRILALLNGNRFHCQSCIETEHLWSMTIESNYPNTRRVFCPGCEWPSPFKNKDFGWMIIICPVCNVWYCWICSERIESSDKHFISKHRFSYKNISNLKIAFLSSITDRNGCLYFVNRNFIWNSELEIYVPKFKKLSSFIYSILKYNDDENYSYNTKNHWKKFNKSSKFIPNHHAILKLNEL